MKTRKIVARAWLVVLSGCALGQCGLILATDPHARVGVMLLLGTLGLFATTGWALQVVTDSEGDEL